MSEGFFNRWGFFVCAFFFLVVWFFFAHRNCVSNGSDYDLYSVSASFYLLLYKCLAFAIFLESVPFVILMDFFYNQHC